MASLAGAGFTSDESALRLDEIVVVRPARATEILVLGRASRTDHLSPGADRMRAAPPASGGQQHVVDKAGITDANRQRHAGAAIDDVHILQGVRVDDGDIVDLRLGVRTDEIGGLGGTTRVAS